MNNEVTKKSPCKDVAKINEVKRLKIIAPELVLDIDVLGIIPIGTDEIFVRIENSNIHYISNYGRCVSITDKARILNGFFDKKLKYEVIVWENDERVSKQIAADRLVLDAFYDYDQESRHCIWHAGENMEDNYYLNLYPVTHKEYQSLKKYVENGGFDSNEKIVELLTGEAYFVPSILGVGYWGSPDVDVMHWTYRLWSNMLARCYSDVVQKNSPHYIGCTVDEEWHNYSNFKEWVENNYYQVGYESSALDKDILKKGNKVYSKNTCIFVPQEINFIFTNNQKNKGDYPHGIIKKGNKFIVRVNKDKNQVNIGSFNTLEEAFGQYKLHKEEEIRRLAEQYKDKVPDELYNALMNWQVEFDD